MPAERPYDERLHILPAEGVSLADQRRRAAVRVRAVRCVWARVPEGPDRAEILAALGLAGVAERVAEQDAAEMAPRLWVRTWPWWGVRYHWAGATRTLCRVGRKPVTARGYSPTLAELRSMAAVPCPRCRNLPPLVGNAAQGVESGA